MEIKSYNAKKIGESKFNNFYERVISASALDLSDLGFEMVCGDIFGDSGKELTEYLGRILKQSHISEPLIKEVEGMIKKNFNIKHVTYHTCAGSTIIVYNKPEDFDKSVYGDVKIWGDRIDITRKSLEELAEREFSLEEVH